MSNWQQEIYEAFKAKQSGSTAKRQTTRKPKVDYKAIFLAKLKAERLPMPTHGQGCSEKEYQFHESRRWRFDFCYIGIGQKIAIEYQGLNWKGGGNSGHQSIDGLRNDCAKFTEASLSGWTLILITAETVNNGQAVEWVRRALHGEK